MAKLDKGVPGYKRTIALIVALGAAPPIATDLYLPALPQMTEVYAAPESLISLTLTGFFLFMAMGTLVFGPISDKFGRKKPLFAATLMFAACGLASGLSVNVWMLIAMRVLQGIGGGGMVAISMALVKDCFEGKVRERVLVLIQAIGVVAPMCAPVLGAFILQFAAWRFTFFAMSALGFACLILVALQKESLPMVERINESIPRTIGRLFVVVRNKAFTVLLLLVAIHSAPFMGYIACASYIYMDFFGLSAFQYSAFFATNAALSVVGAGLVLIISGRIAVKKIISGMLGISLVAGLGLLILGEVSPFAFLILFGFYALMGSVSRPFTTNILLEQQDGDTGSASSLINFVCNISGSLGMLAATLPWPSYIFGLGAMISTCTLAAVALWVIMLRSKTGIRGV